MVNVTCTRACFVYTAWGNPLYIQNNETRREILQMAGINWQIKTHLYSFLSLVCNGWFCALKWIYERRQPSLWNTSPFRPHLGSTKRSLFPITHPPYFILKHVHPLDILNYVFKTRPPNTLQGKPRTNKYVSLPLPSDYLLFRTQPNTQWMVSLVHPRT